MAVWRDWLLVPVACPLLSSHQPHPVPEVDLCTHRWQLRHVYPRSLYTLDHHKLVSGRGPCRPWKWNLDCLDLEFQIPDAWKMVYKEGVQVPSGPIQLAPQTLCPGEGYSQKSIGRTRARYVDLTCLRVWMGLIPESGIISRAVLAPTVYFLGSVGNHMSFK